MEKGDGDTVYFDGSEVVQTIIDTKADVNAKGNGGNTAINFAKSDQVRTLLKDAGAN